MSRVLVVLTAGLHANFEDDNEHCPRVSSGSMGYDIFLIFVVITAGEQNNIEDDTERYRHYAKYYGHNNGNFG